MDAGLTPWAGYVYILTWLFTVADTVLIKAEPSAVEFGHPLIVNCSSSCVATSILMERLGGQNETKQSQWVAHSYSTILSWSLVMYCTARCSSKEKDRLNTTIPVYNRELNITSPPEVLEINTTYSLECTGPRVDPINKLILKWQRGNKIIETNSTEEISISHEDKRLRNVLQFTARTTDDGQVYTCVAEVDLGSNTTLQITNSSVTLQTYREPRSTMISVNNQSSSESPVHVASGDNITLVCDTLGNPEPTIKWEYPESTNIANYSSAVYISEATTENNGIYKCTASNKYGADENKVEIKVKDKSAIIIGVSVTALATATLASGAVIYYLYQKAQKSQEYKVQNAKPHNNPQVLSGQ
ncbi:hemicentin-1-like isoform X2 [Amblyraja radiata]|uniref:hemicentin-1-like isoform X2 n=1 Tax=Amblyraja radiata TaxID=386614 RepID=UPI001402D502|nr:hemicentin-1-like isoform X2 [Amblyraja radiata]